MTQPDEKLAERVAKEIRQLHKGRGLQAGDLDSRLGPLLGELAGTADAADRRQALITEINRCAGQLLEDYHLAVGASLALSEETTDEPLFTRRATWLAERIDRDSRTALRRIREAEWRLAELIAGELQRRRGRISAAPNGWYVAELRTVMRLDGDIVESEQDRRIVSSRENLTEVMAWLDLPSDANQPGSELRAEIRYGGRLLRKGTAIGQPLHPHRPAAEAAATRRGASLRLDPAHALAHAEAPALPGDAGVPIQQV